mgnify:CR=1 FL=1
MASNLKCNVMKCGRDQQPTYENGTKDNDGDDEE